MKKIIITNKYYLIKELKDPSFCLLTQPTVFDPKWKKLRFCLTEKDSREIDKVFRCSLFAWVDPSRESVANEYEYGQIIEAQTKIGVIITPSWYNSRKGPNGEQWSVVMWATKKEQNKEESFLKEGILETVGLSRLPRYEDYEKTRPKEKEPIGDEEMAQICKHILLQ